MGYYIFNINNIIMVKGENEEEAKNKAISKILDMPERWHIAIEKTKTKDMIFALDDLTGSCH